MKLSLSAGCFVSIYMIMAQKRMTDFFGGPKSKKSCVVEDESVNLLSSSSEEEEEIEPVEDAEVPRPLGDSHPSRSTVQPGPSLPAAWCTCSEGEYRLPCLV